jgi:hypothetical protein
MNTQLLLQVKAAILAEPHLFDMEFYLVRRLCGTAACIAGHAVHIAAPQVYDAAIHRLNTGGGYFVDLGGEGKTALDIDAETAKRLFLTTRWPEEFLEAYEDCATSEQRAVVAAQRIDHFIATNGAD